MSIRFGTIIAIAALSSLSIPVSADEIGKSLFMENCASCHGASGVGDGEMAEFMSVDVPDLTRIAQANDGVFPTLDVMHIIDGRTGVRLRGHGSEMPIWGNAFSDPSDLTGDYSDVYASRGRVVSLVFYLASLQK